MLAQGERVAEFERAFAAYIGVEHAIGTSNGTTALHVALLANGIGPGDRVLTTPFTFIASINAILHTGAEPLLVDVDSSFNLDPALIRSALTPTTRAIMPVHLFGLPCDMGAIMEIAAEHDLLVIEDAAQAHGAKFGNQRVGSFGTGCFSFYATKNMTTGEGGMITTDNAEIAAHARRLVNHGMQVRYQHESPGYNFRMTEVAGAIGIEQLAKLDTFNARRAETAAYYDKRLGNLPALALPLRPPNTTHVYHQYTIQVLPGFPMGRDQLAAELEARGIGTGIYYPLSVHRQPAVADAEWARHSFPNADEFAARVLSLPVHPLVSDAEREFIADTIRELAG
jgi:dTDP-4-amino-4,6-dideoxygalactose transaminase